MLSRILNSLGEFCEMILDRVVAAAGFLVFIQIPAFLVQYQQRLGGHVDELAHLIKKYKSAAADNGRTIDEYIGLHLQSAVKEFVSTGKLMTENMERFTELSKALKSLSESKGIIKFFTFIRNFDIDIFKAAFKNFVPGLSFSIDTIIYGFTGIIVFMMIYLILKKSLLFIVRTIKSR